MTTAYLKMWLPNRVTNRQTDTQTCIHTCRYSLYKVFPKCHSAEHRLHKKENTLSGWAKKDGIQKWDEFWNNLLSLFNGKDAMYIWPIKFA